MLDYVRVINFRIIIIIIIIIIIMVQGILTKMQPHTCKTELTCL